MINRKIIACLLTVAMIAGCVPVSVLAEEIDEPSDVVEAVETEETDVPEESGEPEETSPEEEEEITVEDEADLYDDGDTLEPVAYEFSYYDEDQKIAVAENRSCDDYINLSDVADTSGVTLSDGKWYVVDTSLTYGNRINISGNVSIILVNGNKLTCNKGIHVGETATLNIYGQTDWLGELYAEAYDNDNAAIGGNSREKAGVINIYSGNVSALSNAGRGAAIGGGMGDMGKDNGAGTPKSVNIYGGSITAENNNYGAGIGGGAYGSASWEDGINIYGGVINAKGHCGGGIGSGPEATGNAGVISIYGGSIIAVGYSTSAGIGGGESSSNGDIHIYGGVVNASAKGSAETGAGIGSGYGADQDGIIYIHDGIIYSTSRHGAGIGAGYNSDGGVIRIDLGIVCATSSEGGAGIGGGKNGDGARVTINGGVVQATSRYHDDDKATYDKWMEYASQAYLLQRGTGSSIGNLCTVMFALIYDKLRDTDICGAGIGGGFHGDGNYVEINGGRVEVETATEYGGCGIGRGHGGDKDGDAFIKDGLCVVRKVKDGETEVEETALYADRVRYSRNTYAQIIPCEEQENFHYVKRTEVAHDVICNLCGDNIRIEEHTYGPDNICTACGDEASPATINYITKDSSGKTVNIKDYDYAMTDYTLLNCTTAPEGKVFAGWLKRDTGIIYDSGDTIRLEGIFTFEAIYYSAVDTYYIDENGARQEVTAWKIDPAIHGLRSGWYVADSSLTLDSRKLSFCGDVKLILADDVKVVLPEDYQFVTTDEDASLTVYGQSLNNGRMEMAEYRGYDYTQYGGAATYDEYRGQGVTAVEGGSFTCSDFDMRGECRIGGGKTEIGTLTNNTELPVNIGWKDQNDSISIGQTSQECAVVVADGQSFTDGTAVLSGDLTGSDIAGRTLIPYDGLGVRLVGHRVSLEGDIGMWFYMDLDPSLLEHDGAVMRFTVPSGNSVTIKDVPVKDAKTETVGGRTYYKFKCNVAAKDIASPVKAQIIDGDRSGFVYSYSVSDYASYLIEHAEGNEEYTNAVPLVKALLNYGAYAQKYFGITENVITPDPDAIASVTADKINKPYQGGDALPAGVVFAGASLSLKGELTMSLYFKSDVTLNFACGDMTVDKSAGSGYQVARLRGIPAGSIGEDFTVTFTSADGSVSGSVTYSPLNYCYNVLHAEAGTYGSDLENVCKALYVLYEEM